MSLSQGYERPSAHWLSGLGVVAGCVGASATLALHFSGAAAIAPTTWAIGISTTIAILASAAYLRPPGVSRQTLDSLRRAIDEVASGDLSAPIPSFAQNDSFAPIALALERLKASCRAQIETAKVSAEPQIEATSREFRTSVAVAMDQLSADSERVVLGTDQLTTALRESARRLRSAIESAQASCGPAPRAGPQMSSNSSGEAIESRVFATRDAVIEAARATGQTAQTINGLMAKANEVGEFVGLVQDLAAQTKLLALNATIDAVRAGESGRRFVAVAREVKALAGQTTQAAERIAEHVAAIRQASTGAAETIAAIDATMRQANGLTETLAAAVLDQAQAVSKIARDWSDAAAGADRAARDIGELSLALGQTDAVADEVRAAAIAAAAQAKKLRETMDRAAPSAAPPKPPDDRPLAMPAS